MLRSSVDTFLNLFSKKQLNPGYVPEIAPLAARHDLIFGAGETIKTPTQFSWKDQMGTRKLQWASPFCVSYTSVHLREWFYKQDKVDIDLEPDYLGLASGTTGRGNSVQAVFDYSRKNGYFTTQEINIDVQDIKLLELPYSPPQATPDLLNAARGRIIKGYAFLDPTDVDAIKRAILKAPIGVTFGLESTTFNARKEGKVIEIPTKPFGAYHAVVGMGYDERGIEIFDSLNQSGYFLPWGYPLTSAFVVEELPDDWKEVQESNNTISLPNNANRYGKPRDYEAEIKVASLMLSRFRAFNNKSVFDAAGRFWTIYIRAITYGNYSTTDVVNDCYHWRRTGNHVFNLDKPRL